MSNFLTNTWVRYWTRSYDQINTAVLTTMQGLVPEITDHNDSNLFVKLVKVFSGLTEMLGYYIDNAGREAFIHSCRLYASAVKIARMLDYRIHPAIPASVDLTFTFDLPASGDYLIPADTVCSNDDGVLFITTEAGTILDGTTSVIIPARQIGDTDVVESFVATGTAGDEYPLASTKLADTNFSVEVNSTPWTHQDTLGFSDDTDTHYILTIDEDGRLILQFGDDVNGVLPTGGWDIDITFRETEADAANDIGADEITTIVTALTIPPGYTLTVNNESRVAGGQPIETLASLKVGIPISLRTKLRAVTEEDYIDLASLAPGVAKAGVDYSCGKFVDLHIVPEGGGIASQTLVDDTITYFDDKRMITTNVRGHAAGEMRVVLRQQVWVLSGYDAATVGAAVQDALDARFNWDQMEVGGSMHISDIYQTVESVEGVSHSNLTKLDAVPYAAPQAPNTDQLVWTRSQSGNLSTHHEFEIRFISGTQFYVLQDGGYIGTGTTGTPFNVTDVINFTIAAGSYSVNDTWVFHVYPREETINLEEMSIAVMDDASIFLEVYQL